MTEIRFRVQGSAAEPYNVLFVNRGSGNISAYCTCPAGDNGQCCKHRFAILDGSTNGIVSPNESDVATVASWLPGSDIEQAIQAVRAAEAAAQEAKRRVSQAKKDLARAMRD